MTEERLAALDPRRDLYEIRRELGAMLADGQAVDALYGALADRDLVALVDLVVGPQALRGAGAVRAALGLVPRLETAVGATGLYRRLVDLGGEAGLDVLEVACARHPTASWLVALSARVEGPSAGLTHLRAVAGLPYLPQACQSHARAGHIAGLVAFSAESGRVEPALALLGAGHLDPAVEAAMRALEQDPEAPVVESLAAVWGPDMDPLLCRLLPHLRSASAAAALAPHGLWFPNFGGRLAVVQKALRLQPRTS